MTASTTIVQQIINIGRNLPWPEIVLTIWQTGRSLLEHLRREGLYEVLEYESALELKDSRGRRAHFKKRQLVRYSQDNIMAYQDQVWGDGDILLNYRCSPGVVADRYRPGHKVLILISLREVKGRGDIDEFHITHDAENAFTRDTELWETEINHRTRRLTAKIVFPKSRPPQKIWTIERKRRRTQLLKPEQVRELPDGRWVATWQVSNPRVHEHYQLKWQW